MQPTTPSLSGSQTLLTTSSQDHPDHPGPDASPVLSQHPSHPQPYQATLRPKNKLVALKFHIFNAYTILHPDVLETNDQVLIKDFETHYYNNIIKKFGINRSPSQPLQGQQGRVYVMELLNKQYRELGLRGQLEFDALEWMEKGMIPFWCKELELSSLLEAKKEELSAILSYLSKWR